ncbi:MAG: DUF1931 family protein [Actinomycetota bacterium]
MPTTAVDDFERFFREAAGLDIDKQDVARYQDFVVDELHDLLVVGEAAAKENLRDVIEPYDLPITKGLQEQIRQFDAMDRDLELRPILDRLAARPPLDLSYSDETESWFPRIAGGISVAMARCFRILDPNVRNPASVQWERAEQLFDLVL